MSNINDRGDIAFFASLEPSGFGIFVGGDADNDAVIKAGDTLFGQTITGLTICTNSLNNSGQIAFFTLFTDGTSAIVRADPVPIGITVAGGTPQECDGIRGTAVDFALTTAPADTASIEWVLDGVSVDFGVTVSTLVTLGSHTMTVQVTTEQGELFSESTPQVSRYLVKDFETSKSPKSTRKRDAYRGLPAFASLSMAGSVCTR